MAHKTEEKGLKELVLFHLGNGGSKLQYSLTIIGIVEKETIFSEMHSTRIRSNSHELQQERLQLNARIEFFSTRAEPTGCDTSTLEVLKT